MGWRVFFFLPEWVILKTVTSSSQHPSGSDSGQRPLPQITQKQAQRINAPARNMVISMIVMILLIIPVIWLMPQPNKNPYRPSVDVPSVAYAASQEAGYPVAAAQQEGWHYNYARWNSNQADGIDFWQTGQVTPSSKFIELTQARGTNATWLANITDRAVTEGTAQVAGVEWEIRSAVDPDDKEKVTTFYIGEVQGTTLVLEGEADQAEFQQLAQSTVEYMKSPQATASPTPSSGIQ